VGGSVARTRSISKVSEPGLLRRGVIRQGAVLHVPAQIWRMKGMAYPEAAALARHCLKISLAK
jgi:hypothetical protein